jgi:glycosyltransferase involved in cell wall biosynthesis
MMNLLVLTIHSDPTIQPGSIEGGGTNLYINELIDMLIFKKINTLLITRKASEGKDLFKYGEVKIARIKLGPEAQWDKSNLDNLEVKIEELISIEIEKIKFKPDLIHSVYWYSGRAALKLSEKFGVPFVHTIISNGYRKKISGYGASALRIETEKKIFKKASCLISVSNQEKSDLIKFYDITPEKIKVIGRGVDNVFIDTLFDNDGTLLPKSELRHVKFSMDW